MAEDKKTTKSSKAKTENEKAQAPNINEIFSRLDDLIKEMEDPKLSLEESFEKYTEGLKLLKTCNESIDKIEKQIEILEAQE